MRVGIIGRGMIGKELKKRLKDLGHTIVFFYHPTFPMSYRELLNLKKPDAVFLAISTKDEGEAARDYILTTVNWGIPIITCEKGALSHYAHDLMPYKDHIGFRASVGGGSALLKYADMRHVNGQPVEIHGVLNGTLNFIFDKLQQGSTVAEACHEAGRLGYAEPGATDPLALINGELKDVVMKICVFHNLVLSPEISINPQQINLPQLSNEELHALSGSAQTYRFIVSFSNYHKSFGKRKLGASINVELSSGWNLYAAFREISREHSWLPSGVGNALQIIEGHLGADGKYCVSGPGAGPGPTTKAMLDDFRDLVYKQ